MGILNATNSSITQIIVGGLAVIIITFYFWKQIFKDKDWFALGLVIASIIYFIAMLVNINVDEDWAEIFDNSAFFLFGAFLCMVVFRWSYRKNKDMKRNH